MKLIDNLLNSLLSERISREVDTRLSKQTEEKKQISIWDVPTGFNQPFARIQKPQQVATNNQLREISVNYPIARSCIDYLKTQITQLEWNVIPLKSDDDRDISNQVNQIVDLLRSPSGHKSKFSSFLDKLIEDHQVIGAVSIARRQTRGGQLLNLLPIDVTTIRRLVYEDGRIPEPPDIAFQQIIKGKVKEELTTDDLIYEVRNSRTNTPYGLGPLESLILTVTAALKSALYNVAFLTEGNIPEGFIALPPEVATNKEQVREWQEWFDSFMAGNTRFMRRLKAIPKSDYVPTKKPEDMSFEKFEVWLLKQTCAVFGVPPQEIGFTMDVNRSTGEVQELKGKERGMRPLANFLKEIFDDVIQEDLGFVDLQFSWTNIDPANLKEEIEIADKKIKLGAMSVDEFRQGEGDEPIGLGHYVMTAQGPILVSDIIGDKEDKKKKEPKEEREVIEELRRWKRAVKNDLKNNKPIRKFETDIIDGSIKKDIEEKLNFIVEPCDLNKVFDSYISGGQTIEGIYRLYYDVKDALGET